MVGPIEQALHVANTVRQLHERYPGSTVHIIDKGAEVIAEVEPGKAVAVISLSRPHVHLKTAEHYKILRGELRVRVGAVFWRLQEGEELDINPGMVHSACAVGEAAWVEVTSKPCWSQDDHILIYSD